MLCVCVFVFFISNKFTWAIKKGGKIYMYSQNYICLKKFKTINVSSLKSYFVHLQNNKCIISLDFNGKKYKSPEFQA